MRFKNFTGIMIVLAVVFLSFTTVVLAAEETKSGAAVEMGSKAKDGAAFYFGMTVLVAGLAIALGTIATGLGQGNAVAKAVEGIARQPEAAGSIQTVMIIGLAFIESLTIYVLLISLILLFVNPFAKYFVQ